MYIIYFFIYFYQFLFFYFFFFQAEDGIRDGHVTGVQTCALPISGHFTRRGVLGEHRRIPRRSPVRRDRRLHHQLAHCGRLLAGREQLHRPDHVELFDRRARRGPGGGDLDRHVHHGVDLRTHDHLRDQRVLDVGAYEFDLVAVAAVGLAATAYRLGLGGGFGGEQRGGLALRRGGVHGDDPLDGRVGGEPGRYHSAEIAAYSSDEYGPRFGGL